MPAKPQVLMDKLRKHLEALDRDLEGVLGVVVRDLTSGSSLELRGRDTFPSASTIKLAVLYELYRQAEEGRVDLSAVVQPASPRVAEGVLERLSFRVSLTVRDLAVLMMGWSDNEATNELVRRLGRERVNERLISLGLSGTRLRRLMMDLDAARQGRRERHHARRAGPPRGDPLPGRGPAPRIGPRSARPLLETRGRRVAAAAVFPTR